MTLHKELESVAWPGAPPLEELVKRELGEALQRAIEELPPAERAVALMKLEVARGSGILMAQKLGLSPGRIGQIWSRAKRLLRRKLGLFIDPDK
jgi:DNA-directed RNA polymerase specialized sigma24 family protein